MSSLKKKIKLLKYIRITPFEASNESGRAQERNRRIAVSAVCGWASQIVNYVVMIVIVPLLLKTLGAEQYGLWVAVSSAGSLADLCDFGIGSGLVNLMGRSKGEGNKDQCKIYVSSAYIILSLIMALIGLLGLMVIPKVNWSAFFQISDPFTAGMTRAAITIYFLSFLLNLIFGVSNKVRMVQQEMYINNLFMALAKVIMLIGLLWGIFHDYSLLYFFLILSGSTTCSLLLNSLFLYLHVHAWLKPKIYLVRKSAIKELLSTGGFFFWVSVSAVLSIKIDSLVIGKFLGASMVPVYAIPLQLFMVSEMFLTYIMTPLWPAYREAFTQNDLPWIRKTFWRSVKVCLLARIPLVIVLLFFTVEIVDFWIGESIEIPQSLIIALTLNTCLGAISAPLAMLLNGANIRGFRAYFSIVSAGVNLALSIYFVNNFGVSGPVYATFITQSCISLSVSIYYAGKVLRPNIHIKEDIHA